MNGYIVIMLIGLVMTFGGSVTILLGRDKMLSSSRRKGLYEEWIHTRRVGLCIGFEGIAVVLISDFCMRKHSSLLMYILIPASVIICGVILYFIYRHNPMEK